MNQKEYTELKQRLEEIKKAADEAQGALKEKAKQLAKLGYENPQQAKKALTKLTKRKRKLEAEVEQVMESFEDEYSQRIGHEPPKED